MTSDKTERKERPIASGVLGYFPDAIAEVANVSYVGNQQHNPGQPMHWDKSKSPDHADCVARHLIEAGMMDTDGLRHSAKVAWRALAMLQVEIEKEKKVDEDFMVDAKAGIAAYYAKPERPVYSPESREEDYQQLIRLGCPAATAHQVVMGITYVTNPACDFLDRQPYVYIAGPMRGYDKFNFPAFDAAREKFLALGFHVISPADIDRAANPNADDTTKVDVSDQTQFALRDFWSLFFLKRMEHFYNGIVMLPGWEKSVGATGEFFLARWLQLLLYDPKSGAGRNWLGGLHDFALIHATRTYKE